MGKGMLEVRRSFGLVVCWRVGLVIGCIGIFYGSGEGEEWCSVVLRLK